MNKCQAQSNCFNNLYCDSVELKMGKVLYIIKWYSDEVIIFSNSESWMKITLLLNSLWVLCVTFYKNDKKLDYLALKYLIQ